MNTSSQTSSLRCGLAFAAVLASVSIGRAQLAPPGLAGDRVLGQRYVTASAGILDPRASGIDDKGHTMGLGVNFPAGANVDFGVDYGYGTIGFPGGRVTARSLGGTLVVHAAGKGLTPFAGLTLGHEWTREGNRRSPADSAGFWGVGAGVEIPAGRASFTPQVARTESFENIAPAATHYGVHANIWLTERVAGFANVTFSRFARDAGEAWSYRAGLRFKL